jgi:phosphoglycerate kinase
VALRLAELLGEPVRFVDQTVGDKVRMAVKRAPKRGVIVLENLRFDPREEANDESFAKQLAEDSGARYFVQDGFAVVHRAHASTEAITHYLPGVAGLLVEREVSVLTSTMKAPKRPLVAVMGGAKVSDKIPLVKRFIEVADQVIIGGAMANTFLAYKGHSMGKSKIEPGQEAVLREIYAAAEAKVGAGKVDDFLLLPTDIAVATQIDANEPRRVVSTSAVGANDIALDIGDASIEEAVKAVSQAKTVIWNGTLGYAELPNFSHGSARMALALAAHPDITSVIGGGDTADFVLHWDAQEGKSFTHVSTGGGASLELMAGEKLPGVESLLDA